MIAHEQRHLVDIKHALRLERQLAELAPGSAAAAGREAARLDRIKRQLASLWSHPLAEARAFAAQARALGLAGQPLGNFWRAPQGGPMDETYPPDKLNRALIQGYLAGLGQAAGAALRQASPEQRAGARSYLRGYRNILAAQAEAYVQARRADAGRDPGALARYRENASRLLEQAPELPAAGGLGAEPAFALGQADAIRGAAPRLGALLGR